MNKLLLRLMIAAFGVCALAGSAPAIVAADNGHASPTLSFFSGGGGAHADWFRSDDQPPGDTDGQAIRLLTTTTGYAGILFHHVTGIPAAEFPDSEFWNKTPFPYTFEPATLGSLPPSPYAWRGWTFEWNAEPGNHELVVRATDATGSTQPIDQPWNHHGLANNMAQRVPVTVRVPG